MTATSRPARRGRPRRGGGPTPFDWQVGCGTFGLLTRPDGQHALVETIRFDDVDATVVRLTDGAREIVPWPTGRYTISVLDDEAAAARAGMPPPRRLKVGDGWRRIDPFHTERHRSPPFRELVALIYARGLPCRYSLLGAAENPGLAPDFAGPAEEDPEQTAANTSERIARDPSLTFAAALEQDLLADAAHAAGDLARGRALLASSGWTLVLTDLAGHLQHYSTLMPALAAGEPIPPADPAANTPQLALFGDQAPIHSSTEGPT
jgi:hypothetical protein